MVAKNTQSSALPDLKNLQIERDQQLALRFVELGEARQARKRIEEESGIPLRTIYRAIEREIDWARVAFAAGERTGKPVEED